MYGNGQHVSARAITDQAFRTLGPLASFHKQPPIIVGLAAASAILALGMGDWSVSIGSDSAEFNARPTHLAYTSDNSNRIHKTERLSRLSFEERWSAMPTPSSVVSGDRNRREALRAEKREGFPFSCELAFSRLVTKGNFSTRCIAGLEMSKTNT
jgi:hypothetical protein